MECELEKMEEINMYCEYRQFGNEYRGNENERKGQQHQSILISLETLRGFMGKSIDI